MRWTIALLALALAGCTDSGPYDSFEAAMAADGQEYEFGDLVIKVLEPRGDHMHTGIQDVYLLIYNSSAMAPIADLSVDLRAFMPELQHGTENEVDPSHIGHGVYKGHTDIFSPGTWEIHIAVDAPGEPAFMFTVTAESAGSDHHH